MTVKEAQDEYRYLVSKIDYLLQEVEYMLDLEDLTDNEEATLNNIRMSL